MTEELMIAILSLIGTLAGTLGGILMSNRLTGYRLEKLEETVAKHNNLVERVYRLEDSDKLLEEKISVANHRIADLESRGSGS